MKRNTKFIIAIGLVTAIGGLAVAGTSFAKRWHGHHEGYRAMQEAGFDGGYGAGPGGFHRGRGHHAMKLFKQFDANDDGQLTQEEIDSTRSARFADFDGNSDGLLNLQEYEALWLEAMRSRMVDRFQHLDEDGDASVTMLEFQAPFSQMVSLMDRNGDGFLSPEDRPRRKHYHDDDDYEDDEEHEDD